MGLFDFLRRRPRVEDDHEAPAADYLFAHYALRQLALSAPLRFLALMASPDANAFLAGLLKDVEENCGRPASFMASGIKVHQLRMNDFPCAVIEFPEPERPPNAYMVAIVADVDLTSEQLLDQDDASGRYFTLEKGETLTGESRTVLGEWDTTTHMNYGNGPPADVEAFVAAVGEIVGMHSRD